MSMWGSEAVYGDRAVAANVIAEERVAFIRRTYGHLVAAIIGFVVIELILFQTGLAAAITERVMSAPGGYLIALIGFMVVGWVADRMARSSAPPATQYLGLTIYTVAEALFMAPLLYFAAEFSSPDVIPCAAITTLCTFAGLTGVVFLTKKDFSFLSTGLAVGGFLALGLIVCAIIFGINLGVWFAVAMAALMGGYILYYTSNILHHYRTDQHVAASLALFAAVATLFWYVLQIFMRSDD